MSSEKSAVFILAAGLGTRLRPATLKCPKPLIPVAGVEPLFFSVHKAYQMGVRDFYLNAHYLAECIGAAVTEWQELFPDACFEILDESAEVLGTGGALLNLFAKFETRLRGSSLFVVNGDTLAQFDWHDLRGSHSQFAVSRRADHLAKYNPLWSDANGVFQGVGKAHSLKGWKASHFLGVQYFCPEDLEKLLGAKIPVRSVDLFAGIFAEMAKMGRMPRDYEFFRERGTDDATNFWFDMTNEAFLVEAQAHLMKDLNPGSVWHDVLSRRFPAMSEVTTGVFVQGTLPPSTQIRAPLIVAIKEGAELQASAAFLLGPNASMVCGRTFDVSVWQKRHGGASAFAQQSLLVLAKTCAASPSSLGSQSVWVE